MDHLITKSDLDTALQGVQLRLGTMEREQTAYWKTQTDNERRWQELSKTLAKRTVLSSAVIVAIGTVIVTVVQAVSNHSFAEAREQVREMNRQDRAEELKQLSAHDELLIQRTMLEFQRQQPGLIVKGKP